MQLSIAKNDWKWLAAFCVPPAHAGPEKLLYNIKVQNIN